LLTVIVFVPLEKTPLSKDPSSAVRLWSVLSPLDTVIVAPALADAGLGVNLKLLIAMALAAVAPAAVVAVVAPAVVAVVADVPDPDLAGDDVPQATKPMPRKTVKEAARVTFANCRIAGSTVLRVDLDEFHPRNLPG